MTEQTPPKNESNTKSFYGENWFEVVFKISYTFSGLTQYGQYHGCGCAVDKEIEHHITMPA